jgi:hypothetical protein
MRAPLFQTKVETSLFSELFGFVLTDPVALERFHKSSIVGLDLLTLYTTTEIGDKVCEAGAIIPILGVEAGYYSLILRDISAPSLLSGLPMAISSGWVLEVISGTVALCGIGYLSSWNPQPKAVRHVSIPIGWYSVEVSVGSSINDDDFALEFSLTPWDTRPKFKADVTKRLLERAGVSP